MDTMVIERTPLEVTVELAGEIAHDLNNLLTVIVGQSYLLQDLAHDAEGQGDRASRIADAAEQAALLTRQLLASTAPYRSAFSVTAMTERSHLSLA